MASIKISDLQPIDVEFSELCDSDLERILGGFGFNIFGGRLFFFERGFIIGWSREF